MMMSSEERVDEVDGEAVAAYPGALPQTILFSSDGVHPFVKTGHQLYLAAFIRAFEQLKPVGEHPFQHPCTHRTGRRPGSSSSRAPL